MALALRSRKLGDVDHAIIIVKNHKTGALTYGYQYAHHSFFLYFYSGRKESALIVADATSIKMMRMWMKVAERAVPGSHLAFASLDGSELQHLERKVNAAAKVLGHNLPTATKFRKHLEIQNKGPAKDAISRALAHSLATAKQYYQAPTRSDTYKAYRLIEGIIEGTRAASPPQEGVKSGKEGGPRGKSKRMAQQRGEGLNSSESEGDEMVTGRKGKGKRKGRPVERERWGEWKGEKIYTSESEQEEAAQRKREKGKGRATEIEERRVRREWKSEKHHLSEFQEDEYMMETERRGKRRGRTVEEKERRMRGEREELDWSESEEGTSISMSPQVKRQKFTERQTDLISDYFHSEISNKRYPSSRECRDFLSIYAGEFLGRTSKDIYDKCRNLAKSMK